MSKPKIDDAEKCVEVNIEQQTEVPVSRERAKAILEDTLAPEAWDLNHILKQINNRQEFCDYCIEQGVLPLAPPKTQKMDIVDYFQATLENARCDYKRYSEFKRPIPAEITDTFEALCNKAIELLFLCKKLPVGISSSVHVPITMSSKEENPFLRGTENIQQEDESAPKLEAMLYALCVALKREQIKYNSTKLHGRPSIMPAKIFAAMFLLDFAKEVAPDAELDGIIEYMVACFDEVGVPYKNVSKHKNEFVELLYQAIEYVGDVPTTFCIQPRNAEKSGIPT